MLALFNSGRSLHLCMRCPVLFGSVTPLPVAMAQLPLAGRAFLQRLLARQTFLQQASRRPSCFSPCHHRGLRSRCSSHSDGRCGVDPTELPGRLLAQSSKSENGRGRQLALGHGLAACKYPRSDQRSPKDAIEIKYKG